MGGGGSSAPPANQRVEQVSEFPPELRPYITDILNRAKERYNTQQAEGYIPAPFPRVAPFSSEQKQAQQGIVGLANAGLSSDPVLSSAKTYTLPAFAGTLESMGRFGAADATRLMNPYQQAVIDIQKREANRQNEAALQDIADRATAAGSFGDTRHAFIESENLRNQQQLLNDIQAKGSMAGYDRAQSAFEAEKGRELAGARQLSGLAAFAPEQAMKELGGVGTVGTQKQEQTQRGLDVAYQQFLEEKGFPDTSLQQYSSIVRGFPLLPNQITATQNAAPSPMTQLAGALGTGVGLYGALKAKGGRIGDNPINLQHGGEVPSIEDMLKARSFGGLTPTEEAVLKEYEDRKAMQERRKEREMEDYKRDKWLALAAASSNMMGQTGNVLEAAGKASPILYEGLKEARAGERALERESEDSPLEVLKGKLAIEQIMQSRQAKAQETLAEYRAALAKANAEVGTQYSQDLALVMESVQSEDLAKLAFNAKELTLANRAAGADMKLKLTNALVNWGKEFLAIHERMPQRHEITQKKDELVGYFTGTAGAEKPSEVNKRKKHSAAEATRQMPDEG